MPLTGLNIPEINRVWQEAQKSSTLTRESRPPIENLVLEGGGVKGFTYIGALEVLEQNGILKDIKRVAGSSAGGIVALFLSLGCTPSEMKDIMREELDIKKLLDPRYKRDPTRLVKALGTKIGISDIVNLFKNKGVFKTDGFVEISRKLVAQIIEKRLKAAIKIRDQAIIEVMQEEGYQAAAIKDYIDKQYEILLDKYYIEDPGRITLEQHEKLRNEFPSMGFKELFLTGTRLSNATLKVYSSQTDPKVEAVDVMVASACFPLAFEPMLIQGEYIADGGIASNYPMDIFNEERFLTHGVNDAGVNPCTLGLLVDSEKEIKARWGIKSKQNEKLKIKSFVGKIISGMHSRADDLKNKYSINSIQIFDNNISTLNFAVSDAQVEGLIESGRNALQEYIDHYLSDDVIYDRLPSYENVYEKYYAKRPEDLKRNIEQKLWPSIQEMNTFISLLKKIDFDREFAEIELELERFPHDEINEQYGIYRQLEEIAEELDNLQNEISLVDKKLRSYDIKKRNIIASIDEAVRNNNKQKIDTLQKSLIELIKKVSIAEGHKQSLEHERIVIKENYTKIRKQINNQIFELIEQKEKLQYIEKNHILAKLRKTETVLQEHMDIALKALHAHKRDYPDPRINERIDIHIYEVTEEYYQEVLKIYREKDHFDEELAVKKAKRRSEFFADVIQYGIPTPLAKSLTQHFFAMQDIMSRSKKHELLDMQYEMELLEMRRKFFRKLLFDEMDRLKLINLEDDEEFSDVCSFWNNAINEYLANDPTMSQGYAEYLAKEKTIKHWQEKMLKIRQQTYKTYKREMKHHVDVEFAINLNNIAKRFGAGNFSNAIIVPNRNDLKHNLMNTEMVNGETVGLQKSEYSVMSFNSKEKKLRSKAVRRFITLPPIAAHVLVPNAEYLKNPVKKTKELMVLFNEPEISGLLDEYSVAAKYAAARKKQFSEHKQELIKKIMWGLRQIQEQNIQPDDAKIKLTISGVGLAGQDAQYLLAAVIDEMNQRGDVTELHHLQKIELVLTDPSRVSDSLATKTAVALHELKQKRPDLHIKGYNLIHQRKRGAHRGAKKISNYLGDANLLSKVVAEDATVIADFRDKHDPHIQHQILDNKIDSQALQNELNESKLYVSSLFSRQINLVAKKLKGIGKFICFECIPKFAKFFANSIMKMGPLIKKLPNPISRINTHFRKKTIIEYSIPNWQQSSVKQGEDSAVAPSVALTWQEKASSLIERTSPSLRLKREGKPPIENIVLEGGGTPTCAYLGALDQLKKEGLLGNLKRVAGSSGGGIIATLYSLGYSPAELTDLFVNKIHLKDYLDEPYSSLGLGTLFSVQGVPVKLGGIISLFMNKGMYKGDSFRKLIEKLIEIKLEKNIKEILFSHLSDEEKALLESVPAFLPEEERNKRIDDYLSSKLNVLKKKYGISQLGRIDFLQAEQLSKDYPELNIKELYLTVTKVSDASLKVLSAQTEPRMAIADAAFAGVCMPGVFIPFKYGDDYLVDGGIAGNYPMHIFDDQKFLSHGLNEAMANPCTLGLIVDTKEDIEARWGIIPDEIEKLHFPTLIRKVLHGLHNRSSILRGKYNINSIQISDSVSSTDKYESVSKFSFELPKQAKFQLFRNGKEAVQFYHEQYANESVKYSAQDEYEDLYQKYSAKAVPELMTILNTEILPLLEQFKQVEADLRDHQINFQNELHKIQEELAHFDGAENLMRLANKMDSLQYELSLVSQKLVKAQQLLDLSDEAIARILLHREALLLPYSLPKDIIPPDIQERVKSYDDELIKLKEKRASQSVDYHRLKSRNDEVLSQQATLQHEIAKYDIEQIEKVNAMLRYERELAIIDQAFVGKGWLLQEENIILRMLANKGATPAPAPDKESEYLERARPLLLSAKDTLRRPPMSPQLIFKGATQEYASHVFPLFPHHEWEQFTEGTINRFHHKSHVDEMMVVSHTDDGLVRIFGNPVEKLSQVAKALSELECNLEADSLEDATQILKALHAAGFDVACIKKVQIQDATLANHQQFIQSIKQSPTDNLKSKANSTK